MGRGVEGGGGDVKSVGQEDGVPGAQCQNRGAGGPSSAGSGKHTHSLPPSVLPSSPLPSPLPSSSCFF